MAAKAHLTLRPQGCERITLKGRSWNVQRADEEPLRLTIGAGETLDFGKWKIVSPDSPWEFRWPMRVSDHYKVLGPGERFGILEVILHTAERPTATDSVVKRTGAIRCSSLSLFASADGFS